MNQPVRLEAGLLVQGPPLLTSADLAERLLQESEQRFRIMADSAPVLIWVAGTDALCSLFNQRWMEFTGRSIEQEQGNGWAEGIHPEDFQRCMDAYLSSFVTRQAFRMEYRLRRADGEYRWVLDQGVPRFDASGAFAGYIGSCIDVTEMKEANESLTRLAGELTLRTEELRRALAARDDFLSSAAHDLKTPLASALLQVQLLEREVRSIASESARARITALVGDLNRMRGMIEQLLDASRVGETGLVGAREATDLGRLCLEVCCEAGGDRPCELEASETVLAAVDPVRIRQLVRNLVSNADKYSAPGTRIRISVSRREGNAELSVSDQGIGIPQGDLPHIFDRFHRAANVDDRRYPGMGLGLYLCRAIVEEHGGTIVAMSPGPDQGTTIRASLPLSDAAATMTGG